MRFTPYTGRNFNPKPVALIQPGRGRMTLWNEDAPDGVIVGGGQVRGVLEDMEDHRVYCLTGVTALRHLIDARAWLATVWKGRASSMRLDGTRVVVNNLRGALADSATPYIDLLTFLDWIAQRSINPATIGTMAANLWRSTLNAPVDFDCPPEVSTPALFGGRQQATPGRYAWLNHYDIVAAYPHAMSHGAYGTTLRRYVVTPDFDSVDPGIARASVLIPPDSRYGPLPWHHPDYPEVTLYPTEGVIEGWWPLVELHQARVIGASVTVHEAWLPVGYAHPFDAWWRLMRRGRELPDGAGRLAKAVASTLWGAFAMDGELSEWTWRTKNGTDVPRPVRQPQPRNLPHARTRHVAAETTARVRTRLYREGLLAPSVPPLHVDTDGILIRGSVPCPSPSGDQPGQWRLKYKTHKCEIVAPQTYRYTCGKGCNITHPKWHYVCAGRTPDEARMHWRDNVQPVTTSMLIQGCEITLNTVLERRLAAARIAMAQADMVARSSLFPDLSTEEQTKMKSRA